jgi:nicotinamidase-related amidase
MTHPHLLSKGKTILVLVDIQEKLLKVMWKKEGLILNVTKLIKSLKIMEIPVLLTEQYPRGMGKTDESISELVKETEAIEKISFSCMGKEEFNKRIKSSGKDQVVLCGIESHICVLQTVLDLLHQGYFVYVPYDGTSSRKESDYRNALNRMQKEGAVIGSVESAIFELLKKADSSAFRQILGIIK